MGQNVQVSRREVRGLPDVEQCGKACTRQEGRGFHGFHVYDDIHSPHLSNIQVYEYLFEITRSDFSILSLNSIPPMIICMRVSIIHMNAEMHILSILCQRIFGIFGDKTVLRLGRGTPMFTRHAPRALEN